MLFLPQRHVGGSTKHLGSHRVPNQRAVGYEHRRKQHVHLHHDRSARICRYGVAPVGRLLHPRTLKCRRTEEMCSGGAEKKTHRRDFYGSGSRRHVARLARVVRCANMQEARVRFHVCYIELSKNLQRLLFDYDRPRRLSGATSPVCTELRRTFRDKISARVLRGDHENLICSCLT